MDMRTALNIVTEVKTSGFRLHPGLDPAKYVMTDNLGDVSSWKAYTYFANSGGKKGAMDEVGYVMISLVDDTIIPIARGDEHHMGMDALYDLQRKVKDLRADQYVPLYHGSNYIFHREEIKKMLVACRKWLSYGGEDGTITGANDFTGTMLTMSHFIAGDGQFQITPGQLAPLGQAIFDAFKTLAAACSEARNSDKRSVLAKAGHSAIALLQLLAKHRLNLPLKSEVLDGTPKLVREAVKEGDIQTLEELFFGMDGIKNTLHNSLRQTKKAIETKSWFFDERHNRNVWGDIDLAIAMLGRF